MGNGVGGTGIFCQAVIVKIETAIVKVNADVFDDRTELACGVIDQRFFFLG